MQNTWLLLRGPYDAFLAQLEEELAAAGFPDVHASHTGCVFAHLPPEGARLTELAARARLRKQTLSYFVDYLESRGYVERVPDPTDRRAKLVRPTERGREVARVAEAAIPQIDARWAQRLGTRRMARLHALLRDLNAVLGESGSEWGGYREGAATTTSNNNRTQTM